jgi:hypothetical protein
MGNDFRRHFTKYINLFSNSFRDDKNLLEIHKRLKFILKKVQVPHVFLFSKLQLTETFEGVLHHIDIKSFEKTKNYSQEM